MAKFVLTIDVHSGMPADAGDREELINRELERIVPMIADDYREGELVGQDPPYRGWWKVEWADGES